MESLGWRKIKKERMPLITTDKRRNYILIAIKEIGGGGDQTDKGKLCYMSYYHLWFGNSHV